MKAAGDSRVTVNETLPVGVPASACYLFDGDGRAFTRPAQA